MFESYINLSRFPAKVTTSLAIASLIITFALFPEFFFSLLSLDREKIAHGEMWRLLTANFVHFGWAHTLMNLAAFAIFVFALANGFSTARFIVLILLCCLAVGTGVYWFNPEYEIYAGLSGAIHGFFIAGLFLNKRHPFMVNIIFIAAIFGKVFKEHQAGYQATELQALLPVAVAYDAHLYGAAAGFFYGLGCLITDKYSPKKTSI